MNWIENVLIIAGISLDIFAAMECQGSLVAKVDKKHLAAVCGLIAVWQMAALAAGDYFSILLCRNDRTDHENFIGLVLAAFIFFCLGVRLLAEAIRNERIQEHREEKLGFRRFLRMAAVTSLYTMLAGIAFGFLGTSLTTMLVTCGCMTAAVVIAGMYTGYHFGFEHKTKAYICGALLLWIAGADVIIGHIM